MRIRIHRGPPANPLARFAPRAACPRSQRQPAMATLICARPVVLLSVFFLRVLSFFAANHSSATNQRLILAAKTRKKRKK